MRTNEERIAALHRRSAELEQEKRRHRARILQAAAVTVCFAAAVVLAVIIPGVSTVFFTGNPQAGMSASILSKNSASGYIVIGILAFLLGAAVTVFCSQLKKWQDDQERRDSGDGL